MTLPGLPAGGTDPCVHCGFCLPTCASYRVLGTEMDSPRGRIHTLKAIEAGELALDATVASHFDSCLGCFACVSACPESALMDSGDVPRLRMLERNCVQCGLCEKTCPEKAITLVPRLNLAATVREPVTLNEAQPFECIRCAKPFGGWSPKVPSRCAPTARCAFR